MKAMKVLILVCALLASTEAATAASLRIKSKRTLGNYHKGVCCAVLSSSGIAYVVATGSREIDAWQTSDTRRVATLKGHEAKVRALAVSPNGELVASSSDDNTVRLWDVRAEHRATVLTGPEKGVDELAISADGKWAAGGSTEPGGDVWLWEVGTNKKPRVLKGPGTAGGLLKEPPKSIRDLEFSPDGQRLAAVAGGAVILWSLANDALETVLLQPPDSLSEARFSDQGGLLAVGTKLSITLTLSRGRSSVSVSDVHSSLLYREPGKTDETHSAGSADLFVRTASWLRDGRHALVVASNRFENPPPNLLLRLVPLSAILERSGLRGIAEVSLEPALLFATIAIAPDGSRLLQETPNGLYLWELDITLP